MNDSSLSPRELLLYSLMKIVFPSNTFTKCHTAEKYNNITKVFENVLCICYLSHNVRNYFARVRSNKIKGYGKYNGKCRWNFFQKNVDKLLTLQRESLGKLLIGKELEEIALVSLLKDLEHQSYKQNTECEEDGPSSCDVSGEFRVDMSAIEYSSTIKTNLKSDWICCSVDNSIHLYLSGYAEREVVVDKEGKWCIYVEGIQRNPDLQWANLADTVITNSDLVGLLYLVASLTVCSGCSYDAYKELVLNYETTQPVFKTKDGSPAAFVEVLVSKNRKKVIRSVNCSILIVHVKK